MCTQVFGGAKGSVILPAHLEAARLEGAGAMPLSSRWDVSLAEGTPLLAAVFLWHEQTQRQRQEQHLLRSTAPPVPVADRVLPRRDVEARSASQDVSPRGEVVAAMMGS